MLSSSLKLDFQGIPMLSSHYLRTFVSLLIAHLNQDKVLQYLLIFELHYLYFQLNHYFLQNLLKLLVLLFKRVFFYIVTKPQQISNAYPEEVS